MTSYFDSSDAEGLDLGDSDVECIHGVDLFAPCVKCKPMAADGGECPCEMCGYSFSPNHVWEGLCTSCRKFDAADGGEGDDMQDPDKLMDIHEGFTRALNTFMPYELVSMLGRILDELTHQETHANDTIKQVAAARVAVANHGKPPKPMRARRSDAGKPRAAKEHAA
jgi:hypothetical protein